MRQLFLFNKRARSCGLWQLDMRSDNDRFLLSKLQPERFVYVQTDIHYTFVPVPKLSRFSTVEVAYFIAAGKTLLTVQMKLLLRFM